MKQKIFYIKQKIAKKRVFLQKNAKFSSFLSNVFEIEYIFDIISHREKYEEQD